MAKADSNVAAWIEAEATESIFNSAITILELERGVLGIQRRDAAQGARLRAWLDHHVRPEFSRQILPVDDAVRHTLRASSCPAQVQRGRCPDRRPSVRPWHGTRHAQCQGI